MSARFVPEVEIFHKALRYALDYDEIYDATNDVKAARQVIEQGLARATQLSNGEVPWNTATGLVVRAYVSKIDGSVQPYGLVVPPSYTPTTAHKFRLDTWYHGRDEKLTELRFLRDRMRDKGQFTPDNAFVLHLYGRYCNANKLAGEVDLLEALEHVQKHYPIDTNRLVNRGFSMGGAAIIPRFGPPPLQGQVSRRPRSFFAFSRMRKSSQPNMSARSGTSTIAMTMH